MSIKAKLIFIAGLSTLSVILFSGAIFFIDTQAQKAREQEQSANNLVFTVFERNLAFDDYLLTRNKRSEQQLRAHNNRVGDRLTDMLVFFSNDTYVADLKQIENNYKTITSNIGAIIEKQFRPERAPSLPPSTDTQDGLPAVQIINESTAVEVVNNVLNDRLISQTIVNSQSTINIARKLARQSLEDREALDTRASALVVLFALAAIVLSFSAFIVIIPITNSLNQLRQSAESIASGNFEQKVNINSKDELGSLAAAFNTMTVRLRESYSVLEQKVKKRTQALFQEKEKLQQAKAKDDAILAGIGDGLVVTDSSRRITFTNQAVEKTLGWKSGDLLGKLWPDVIQVITEEGKRINLADLPIQKALASGAVSSSSFSISICFTHKDKTRVPVSVTAAPIIAGDKVMGAVVIFRDITFEKSIDKAKTEFVSLASHQLRTPLSAINWYAEMMLEGDAGQLSDTQKQFVGEIYKGNQRMVDLVNALLNVSRLELGTFVVEPEPTNIVEIAQSVLTEVKPQTDAKGLIINQQFTQTIPNIQSDPKLLRIVVQNLITNAVKYTPEKGSVTITIVVHKKGASIGKTILPQDSVCIVVTDTGLGIPKAQQDKIFTKLFRADNVKEKETEGTGLGLYIVKAIIEQSGGLVWFESTENKGSTFYVCIPLSGMKKKQGTKSLG